LFPAACLVVDYHRLCLELTSQGDGLSFSRIKVRSGVSK
jgi:hypothetical protein